MSIERRTYFYRLCALWAFSEALLGGILHGLRLPFSGLLLAGLSAVCISWLGKLGSREILKALLLVLSIKAGLSPHTPLAAYFAVSLQAVAGALFFSLLPGYRLATVFSCLFALLQSALQKIIILSLLFGVHFWEAVDAWLKKLLATVPFPEDGPLIWLVGGWLLLYGLVGICWALFALQAPAALPLSSLSEKEEHTLDSELPRLSYRRLRYGLMLPALLLLLFGFKLNGWQGLVLRSMGFLLVYWTLLMPLLHGLLEKLLQRSRKTYAIQLHRILQLLPATQQFFLQSWQQSASGPGWLRPLRMARTLAAQFQPPGTLL